MRSLIFKKRNQETTDNPSADALDNLGYVPPEGYTYNVVFWIAVAAFLLALLSHSIPWVGAIVGALAIILLRACKVPRTYLRAPRATVVLSALAIALSTALSVYNPQPGAVRLSIDAPSWRQSYGSVLVNIDGITDAGEVVHESVEVTPGSPLTLDELQTGDYTFTVDESSLEHDEELFEPTQQNGELTLELEKDVELTLALALVPQDGTLGFTVNAPDWDSSYGQIPVVISGTTHDGSEVEESVLASPGKTYSLADYEKGHYTFTVEKDVLTQGTTVFSASTVSSEYDKREDVVATVDVTIDKQATQALIDKKEQEEAEARAKAEAEAKAKAEAEERAKAEAEAEARAEAKAQAEQQQRETASETVYITNTGEKYHRYGCQYLRKSCIPISLSEAKARGYEPCSRCF